MKKTFSLLTLLLLLCSSAWAQDPTWYINTSSAASSAWVGTYHNGDITVAFSTGSSGTKYDGGAYVLGNNPSSGWGNNCLEITSTSVIEKISFLVSSNDKDGTSIQPAVLAWEGTASVNVDVAWYNSATSSIKNSYSDAVEQTYTFTGKSYKRVRIYRKASPKIGGASSATNVGNGTTCKVWGIKVWLKSSDPVDPVFSLTKESIGTNGTSQIQVGSKGNLDGISFDGDVTFGTPGIVTVNAEGVVSPVTTGTTTINFNTSAVANKYNASTSNSLTITVTEPIVPTPTITEGGTFYTSKSVEIECEDDDATIKYSYDNTNWVNYTTALSLTESKTVYAKAIREGYTDSETVHATYTIVILDEQSNVSTPKTWSWADLAGKYTANSNNDLKLADDGKGDSKGTEVLMSNIPKYGRYTINYPASFDAQSLLFKGEYPVRVQSANYVAGAIYIKLNTTVDGKIIVTYADNGSNDRKLRITDQSGSYDGDASSGNTDYKTFTHSVVAGEIKLAGYDGSSDNYIRFKEIVFNPTISGTISPCGWSTFSSNYKLDMSTLSGGTAYYASSSDENTVTLSEISSTAILPANTGIMIKGTANASFSITTSQESATFSETNFLKGQETTGNVSATNHYVFGYVTENPSTYGFYALTAETEVQAGKAYLEYPAAMAPSFLRIVEGEQSATGVENIEANDKAVKFIENGQLYILRDGVVYDTVGRVIRK